MARRVVLTGSLALLLVGLPLTRHVIAAVAAEPQQAQSAPHGGHQAAPQGGGHDQHPVPTMAKPASGGQVPVGSVLAMDVYAQRDTLDLLLAVQTAAGPELQHRRSRDGARTWSAPVTIDRDGRSLLTPKRGNDAQIAASGDTVVVSWTMKGQSKYGAGALATVRSADGGRTWQAAPSPADAQGQGGQGFTDLAATDGGTFFAAWLDERDGSRGLRLARSTDGGRAWDANVTLDAHTCECCWNTLAAFDAERVAVLYRDNVTGQGGHGGHRDMALAVSGDAGKTWAARGVVGRFAWGFEGCPHVGGGLAQSLVDGRRQWHALVWTGAEGKEGVYVLRSTDEGRTWSEPTRLGGGLGHHGTIVARGSTVTAAWDAATDGVMAIYTASSTDAGVTWSAPRRLSNGGSATHPLVVSTADGVVSFWTEREPNSERVTWVARPLDRIGS